MFFFKSLFFRFFAKSYILLHFYSVFHEKYHKKLCRTLIDEFTPQRRGGKGVKCYKINEKSGNVIGFKAVNDDNEIMLITNQGIVIRILCKDISLLGRITTGVKLINMDIEHDIQVASIAKVRQKSADESESLIAMEQEMEDADNEEGNIEEDIEETEESSESAGAEE